MWIEFTKPGTNVVAVHLKPAPAILYGHWFESQVFGPLLCTWKSWMKLLAPGFRLGPVWVVVVICIEVIIFE